MEKKDIHLLSDEDDTLSDKENEFVSEGIIINEVQLLLAEKRTSLATMRTGITVFVLPLSVLSVLIATSRYYDIIQVMHFIIPLLAICVALVLLGSYLIIRAVIRMRHHDSLIMQLKRKHRWIAEYID
jgi:uncharacterized membrane protein YkgB